MFVISHRGAVSRLFRPRSFTSFDTSEASLICWTERGKRCASAKEPAGPQALGSCGGVDALLDPSGQAEHKRALPLHLAALPYPPQTHGEPDSSLSCVQRCAGKTSADWTRFIQWRIIQKHKKKHLYENKYLKKKKEN